MQRSCWLLSTLLALTCAGLVYWFVVRGETVPATDGRTAIVLLPGERDLVLTEMRAFLGALQTILRASTDNDVAAVADAARKVGVASREAVPASLAAKLPLPFKRLGYATHSRFDQLALDTEQLDDVTIAVPELTELMQNCVACHAAYRFTTEMP